MTCPDCKGTGKIALLTSEQPCLACAVSRMTDAELFQLTDCIVFDPEPGWHAFARRTPMGWCCQRYPETGKFLVTGEEMMPDRNSPADFAGMCLCRDGWSQPGPGSIGPDFFFADVREVLRLAGWRKP